MLSVLLVKVLNVIFWVTSPKSQVLPMVKFVFGAWKSSDPTWVDIGLSRRMRGSEGDVVIQWLALPHVKKDVCTCKYYIHKVVNVTTELSKVDSCCYILMKPQEKAKCFADQVSRWMVVSPYVVMKLVHGYGMCIRGAVMHGDL
eukprot:Gb_07851 [translate_table: standard]